MSEKGEKHTSETCGMQKEWGEQFQMNKTFFSHIKEGRGYRISIMGIIFTIFLQVVFFAVLWGEMKTTVQYQGRDIARVCQLLDNGLIKKIDQLIQEKK